MKIDRLLPNESEKLEMVYRNHERVAYAVSLNILKDPHLAEDCTQDVMEKYALRIKKNGTDDIVSDKAFIVSMAKNTAIDILRKRGREDLKGLDLNPPSTKQEMNPELYITMDEFGFSAEVSDLLEDVKYIDRLILFLHYKEDLGYAEIGEKIGRDANYVSQRVFQLKKRINKEKEKKNGQGVTKRGK